MRALVPLLAMAAGVVAVPLFAQHALPRAPRSTTTMEPGAPDLLATGTATRRLTVPVSVANQGPFAFIVDTGAERSVVTRELAAALNLDRGTGARLFDFSGSSAVNTVMVPSLSVGSRTSTALEAPLLAMANVGAQGMLGVDALQGYKVVIDFGRKRMSLVPAKRHASGEVVIRAHSRVGQLILTRATFDGKPIAVVIDTGSSISVGNSAMRALAKRAPRPLGPVSITSVTGRSFDADVVAVDNILIGGLRFDNFGLSFSDVPPFERLGLRDTPALILGMNALEAFQRVEIDFVNREIAFTLQPAPINFNSLCRSYANCKSF